MTLQLNRVSFEPTRKLAATNESVTREEARQQLIEMAASLVSSGSPKSGFLRLSQQKGQTHLANGRTGSGYTAAGHLVTDLLQKAYGPNSAVVKQFQEYRDARGKVGVKSFLQLVGHLEPDQIKASTELGRLNLKTMGGRLKLILRTEGPQASAAVARSAPVQRNEAPIAEAPSSWSPSKTLALNKRDLQTSDVLCAPTRPQTGSHALHTQAFRALFEARVSFGVPGKSAGDDVMEGNVTIANKAYDYSARAIGGKGSGAGIWMITLKDPTQATFTTNFVIKTNPQKGSLDADPDMAAYFAGLRHKDLGEVQMLDLMSGNEHALHFYGGYSMPDGTLVYGMEKAAGDMNDVAESRMKFAESGTLVLNGEDHHLLQMAKALTDMHACGQVHGDVKSDNFMLGADGKVRIADFGESYVDSTQLRQSNLTGDVHRYSAMAYRLRYGVQVTPDKLAKTIEKHQEDLELPVTLKLSEATGSLEKQIKEMANASGVDVQKVQSLKSQLARLNDRSTALETLMDVSGRDLDESVRSYAINQLLLEAVKNPAPDFLYMAGFTRRLGRIVEAGQVKQPSVPVQPGNVAEQERAPAQPKRRDITGMKVQQVVQGKGVKKLEVNKQIYWYKPSNRPINSPSKCIGMGILDKSLAQGATEAAARLPEREVAASAIAKLLIPHMAVGAELANDATTSGVLLQNAKGEMAADLVFRGDSVSMNKELYSSVQSQLSDLQAFDYLIGNVDRHLENYIIDGKTVRAIDNDLSFPTVSVDKLPGIPDSKFGGLPHGYSKELREGLSRIDIEQLRRDVQSLIGDEAFNQLLDRFDKLKKDVFSDAKAARPAEPSSRFLTGV